MAKFSNHPSGHKALIAHLLRGGRRVRVCLEASGKPVNLLVTAFAAIAHSFLFGLVQGLKRVLPLQGPCLARKVRWGADRDHCFDSIGLLYRHMQ
jgi:hypothetical protein